MLQTAAILLVFLLAALRVHAQGSRAASKVGSANTNNGKRRSAVELLALYTHDSCYGRFNVIRHSNSPRVCGETPSTRENTIQKKKSSKRSVKMGVWCLQFDSAKYKIIII